MSFYRIQSRIIRLEKLIVAIKKQKYDPQKALDIAYEMRALVDQLIYQIDDWGKIKYRKQNK